MTPRQVIVRAADLRSLTGAELFTALGLAGLTRARLPDAVAALQDPDGNPNVGLQAIRFLQATALQLRRREGDDATWEDAQSWDVLADMTETAEEALEAERQEYRVAGSVVTGLPMDQVDELPVTVVDAFTTARRATG